MNAYLIICLIQLFTIVVLWIGNMRAEKEMKKYRDLWLREISKDTNRDIGSVQNDLLRNCIDEVIEQNRGKEVQAETSANTYVNCADVRSAHKESTWTGY